MRLTCSSPWSTQSYLIAVHGARRVVAPESFREGLVVEADPPLPPAARLAALVLHFAARERTIELRVRERLSLLFDLLEGVPHEAV